MDVMETQSSQAGRAAARSVSAIAFNQIAQVAGSLLFVALVPRRLGTEVYGQLAYAFALITLVQMLGELGYQEIFSRFLPEVRRGQGEAGVRAMVRGLLGARILVGLALGLFTVVVARLAAGWLSPAQVGLMALAVVARVWAMGPFPLLLGLGETLKWSVETTWRQIVVTVLTLALVPGPSLTLALAAMTLHEVVFLALGAWWVRGWIVGGRTVEAGGRRSEALPADLTSHFRHLTADFLKFGLVFSMANFALVALFRISPIMVETLTGSHVETGYFDLAEGGLLLLYGVLGQVAYAFVPILTELHLAQRPEEARMWLGRMARYAALLMGPAVGGMWAVATPIPPLLFGADFAPAADTIRMMALALLPLPIAWAGVCQSAVDKRPRRKLWAALAGLVVFLIAAGLLRGGGSAGIALAFALAMLGYALGFGGGALEAARAGGPGWLAATMGALIFLPLFIWPSESLVLALAAWSGLALVYVAAMLAAGVATREEVRGALARRRGA
jgi:O-antigen/teichoic acid export membrane protein